MLELRSISKSFGALKANDDISIKIYPGEIHALLGENGAGKSTLVKIIYGLTQPDSGEIYWQGEKTVVKNPKMSRGMGVGMIFQHFSLFESLTAAENISLVIGDDGDMTGLSEKIKAVSEKYGLEIHPNKPVFSLSVGERQRIEIIRCLLQNPRLLIMDEPTSVLTPQEADQLFATLRVIQNEGCAVFYISHKLEEIKELCHKASILRHGKLVAECDPAVETPKSMAELMIGRRLPEVRKTSHLQPGLVPRLKVSGLSVASDDPYEVGVKEVGFEVLPGEIFGIAGVAGNGQSLLGAALSGETLSSSPDSIVYDGKPIGHYGVIARQKAGIAFVPEERLGRGAVPEMNLEENSLLTTHALPGACGMGLVNFGQVAKQASETISSYDVRTQGADSAAASLSGGNLQKFIIGREIMKHPSLLVVSSPTWGVDAGAEAFIRQTLIDLAQKGASIILISQDLEEVLTLSDHVAVMFEGRMSKAYPSEELTHDKIGLLMGGASI